MQSQERELISGLFGRLQQFEAQPRDPEAESLIAGSVARQPAAPTSFLGGAPKVSPWGVKPATPASVPSTRSPLQAAVAPNAAPAGGGFLRTAMATAAGVAGGALLFEGIRGLMGHNPGPFGQSAGQTASQPDAVPDAQQQAMVQDDNQMAEASAAQDYDTASYDSDIGGGSDDFA